MQRYAVVCTRSLYVYNDCVAESPLDAAALTDDVTNSPARSYVLDENIRDGGYLCFTLPPNLPQMVNPLQPCALHSVLIYGRFAGFVGSAAVV